MRTQRRAPLTNVLERFAAVSSDFMKTGRGGTSNAIESAPQFTA